MSALRTVRKKIGPVKGFDSTIEFNLTELPYLQAREGMGRLGEMLGRAPMSRDLSIAGIGMMLIGQLHHPNVAWLTSQFEARTELIITLETSNHPDGVKVPVQRFRCEEQFPGAKELTAWAEWFVMHVDLNFADFLGEAVGMLGRQLAATVTAPPADGS